MTQLLTRGVEQGCDPTLSGALTVDIAAGGAILDNLPLSVVAAAGLAITAPHATLDRQDALVIDATGPAIVTGTPGVPGFAAGVDGKVQIAAWIARAGAAGIAAADFSDVRVLVLRPGSSYKVAGTWYGPIGYTTAFNSGWVSGDLYAIPYLVQKRMPLQAIGISYSSSGTAGSKARLGIYRDDGAGATALLGDYGQVALDNAAGAPSPTIAIADSLDPGWCWLAFAFQSLGVTLPAVKMCDPSLSSPIGADSIGTIVLRSPNNAVSYGGLFLSGITGALPASLAGAVTTKTRYPGVWVEAA